MADGPGRAVSDAAERADSLTSSLSARGRTSGIRARRSPALTDPWPCGVAVPCGRCLRGRRCGVVLRKDCGEGVPAPEREVPRCGVEAVDIDNSDDDCGHDVREQRVVVGRVVGACAACIFVEGRAPDVAVDFNVPAPAVSCEQPLGGCVVRTVLRQFFGDCRGLRTRRLHFLRPFAFRVVRSWLHGMSRGHRPLLRERRNCLASRPGPKSAARTAAPRPTRTDVSPAWGSPGRGADAVAAGAEPRMRAPVRLRRPHRTRFAVTIRVGLASMRARLFSTGSRPLCHVASPPPPGYCRPLRASPDARPPRRYG